MEQDFTFPIVVKKENKEYIVRFWGLDIAERCYDEGEDYITESKKLLVETLLSYERQHITIPEPYSITDLKTNEKESIIFLNVWLPFYRFENEKYVKKTLTIPDWIDELAKKQNLNFSQILKDALLIELGLSKDIKNLRRLKFRKPMKKMEDFLVISHKLLEASKETDIELFALAVNTKDINLIVTIFTIWINKRNTVFLSKYKSDNIVKGEHNINKQDWQEHAKVFEEELKSEVNLLCSDLELQLNRQNHYDQLTVTELIAYIKKLAGHLIQCALKYDGSFEREENIYDYMRVITNLGMLKQIIKKEYWEEYISYYTFTLKHEIEIPYLYILVWNIRYLYQNEQHSYFDKMPNMKNICHDCLKHLSSTMMKIMLGDPIYSTCLEPKIIAKNENGTPVITRMGSIDFRNVLPFLYCNQDKDEDYVDMHNKIISGNVLSKIPMIPMSLRGGDRMAIKYLLDLLCRDLEK